MPEPLHVYKNGVIEWVVAASAEDAVAFYRGYYKLIDDEEADLEFEQEPDGKVLEIQGDEPESGTCAELAAKHGRGLLCTTEW